jgi:2-dehydropantoate 2-reductase
VKVLVAGTGGVGGYVGARLLEAGNQVTLLARGRNLEGLRRNGLSVSSPHGDVAFPSVQAVERADDIGLVDAVLFCVKAYDNESAADAMAGAVGDRTSICSLQNGVDNEVFLRHRFPSAVVLGGVVRIEAWLESPGEVRQKGPLQDLAVGAFDPADRAAVDALAASFDGTGVPVAVVEDIVAALWFKLLSICGIGGVTAYARRPIGDARTDPDLRRLMIGCFEEVEAVAWALGISLPVGAAAMLTAGADAVDPSLKSSMCRDVEWGRPLEVEALNGAVVRYGETVGVPTPANRTILEKLLPLHRAAMRARTTAG